MHGSRRSLYTHSQWYKSKMPLQVARLRSSPLSLEVLLNSSCHWPQANEFKKHNRIRCTCRTCVLHCIPFPTPTRIGAPRPIRRNRAGVVDESRRTTAFQKARESIWWISTSALLQVSLLVDRAFTHASSIVTPTSRAVQGSSITPSFQSGSLDQIRIRIQSTDSYSR